MQISNEHLPDPILITGAARSGTSLCAGAIYLCNAFGGKTTGPTRHNRKGQFENTRIRDMITKPFLRELRVDPLGQYPLPDINNLAIPLDWRKRVEQVFIEEGYKGGPLFYKGAKMALTWPIWAYHFPNAKWVIVRRKSNDIADSCCNTGFMRAFRDKKIQRAVGVSSEKDGWLWWVDRHLEAFNSMINAGLNCQVVWPERWVSGDYQQLYSLIEWLGLEWNSEVLNFVDPKLWKARYPGLKTSEIRKVPGWWKKDQHASPAPSETARDICSVCGQFGWWSSEDRSYRCTEHRSK